MREITVGEFAASLRGEKLDKNEIRGLILGFEDTPEIWEKARVVRSWIEDLDDYENAERYLNKVENESTTLYELAVCALLWKESFSSKGRACACLIKAQALAVSAIDWYDCFDMWLSLYSDRLDDAKHCFDKAVEAFKKEEV